MLQNATHTHRYDMCLATKVDGKIMSKCSPTVRGTSSQCRCSRFAIHAQWIPSLFDAVCVQVILISIIFGFVVLSSTAVYMAFYQFYVPALGASYDLHLDFTYKLPSRTRLANFPWVHNAPISARCRNKSGVPFASVPIELARNQVSSAIDWPF